MRFRWQLHNAHTLGNLERYFEAPAEERVQRLEASLSKQRAMLQKLQAENLHLKLNLDELEVSLQNGQCLI